MPFQIRPEDISDAEYVEVKPEPQAQQWAPGLQQPEVHKANYAARNIVDLSAVGNEYQIAVYEKRARAISLFVELPILALVSLHDKTPPLVRVGAGLLAIWKAVELARGGAQRVEEVATEWIGQ